MADERTRTERVIDHLAHRLNPATIAREMAAAVTDKVMPQGAAELAGAIFGQGAFTPYGQGQEPVQPLAPGEDIQGPAEPLSTTASTETTREAGEHQIADRWFSGAVQAERDSNAIRTPAERESTLDRWQGMAQAAREAHSERGTAPPMWAVMNREEMRAAFTPEAQKQTSTDMAGQSAKDRFLASNWRDQTPKREISR
jgi:hypothetical protein